MRDTKHGIIGPAKPIEPRNGEIPRQSTGMALVLALVVVLLVSFGASGLIQGTSTQDIAPRPFDPPSGLERALAAETALGDSRVEEQVGDRYVHLDTTLRTEKRPGVAVADHPRLFDVWFYNYETDRVVWAVVDSTQSEVVELVPVDSPLYPPLSGVEVDRARDLALALDTVADQISGELPAVATMLISGEGTACPQNRCVAVAFVEDEGWNMDLMVLVNLSLDEAIRVIEEGWTEVVPG